MKMENKRETPWMHGAKHAAKSDEQKMSSFIHARCLPSDKAAWVKEAQLKGMGLTEWITEILNKNISKQC